MISTLLVFAVLAQSEPGKPVVQDDVPHVRAAVEKSLAYLAKDGLAWETKKCVSCHHGPWMMWTGYEARKRGFKVDEAALAEVREISLKAYLGHRELRPTSRDKLNDLAINTIYLMFGMGAQGVPDAETVKLFDRTAAHLLEQQKDDGSWKVLITKTAADGKTTSFLMPPLIDSDDVTTAWALLALHDRQPGGVSRDAVEQAKARGLKFLCENPPSDTLQSLVVRILLQKRIGDSKQVEFLAEQLATRRNKDGGWSQTQKLGSDALGTGQALVALQAAGMSADEPAIIDGRRYLLNSQKPDGTWFVVSRAYEPPEFSSYIGTAWATLAFLKTMPLDPANATTSLRLPRTVSVD